LHFKLKGRRKVMLVGGLIITNLEDVPGKKIARHLGLVKGSTVRAKHIGRDIMAGFKNIVGGEIKSYTQLMNDARDEAIERMVQEAKELGANAVVNVRLSTASIMQGAAEIFAYGTAVVVE
jgi:uncharacterized protein YbjQ (UPF0145 family)